MLISVNLPSLAKHPFAIFEICSKMKTPQNLKLGLLCFMGKFRYFCLKCEQHHTCIPGSQRGGEIYMVSYLYFHKCSRFWFSYFLPKHPFSEACYFNLVFYIIIALSDSSFSFYFRFHFFVTHLFTISKILRE